MNIFIIKYFFYSCLFFGALLSDSDGWVALSPVIKSEEERRSGEEENPSIWVLFSKKTGDEEWMIQFPQDPSCRTFPTETVVHAGDHTLWVTDRASPEAGVGYFNDPDAIISEMNVSENRIDLVYQKGGMYFAQRHICTDEHLYVLQTKNAFFQRENHEKFISSFSLISSKK